MTIGLSDTSSVVAGAYITGSNPSFSFQPRHLAAIADTDAGGNDTGAAILKMFQGGVPVVNPDTGASSVELAGTYTYAELEVADANGGSPYTALTQAANARVKAIKRVVAQFETAHADNVFRVVIQRTVGNSTRTFTYCELSDPLKKDFNVEGHFLVMPGETVKVVYDGESGKDLWFVLSFQDV